MLDGLPAVNCSDVVSVDMTSVEVSEMGNCVKKAAHCAASYSVAFILLTACFVVGEPELNSQEVDALLPLQQLIQSSAASFAGWSNNTLQDPCGVPTCSQPDSTYKGVHGLPSCAWEGVSCTEGHVTALRLDCTEGCVHPIHGQLPGALQNLTFLETLSVKYNALTGSLPTGEGWSSLVRLELRGNKLQATLPRLWGTTLRKLEYLDLGDNMLHGPLPSAWCNWTTTQFIDLSANSLHGDVPACYAGMATLHVLVLNDNCLMCGGLPFLQARLYAHNTSLGSGCAATAGSSMGECSPAGTNSTLMIAMAAVLGSFMLCLVQRHMLWRWRAARILTYRAAEATERAVDQAERGEVGRHKQHQGIPSFEACVELAEPSAAGQSRHPVSSSCNDDRSHHKAADMPNQPQRSVCGCKPADQNIVSSSSGSGNGIGYPAGRGDSVSEVALWEAVTSAAATGHSESAAVAASGCATTADPVQGRLPEHAAPLPVPTAAGTHVALDRSPHWGACGLHCLPAPQQTVSSSSSRPENKTPQFCTPADVLSPSVVVMPDQRHVALAVPEIVPDEPGMDNSENESITDQQQAMHMGFGAQQLQQQQRQRQPAQAVGIQLLEHVQQMSRHAWTAMVAGFVYLFVQPIHEEDLLPQQPGRNPGHHAPIRHTGAAFAAGQPG